MAFYVELKKEKLMKTLCLLLFLCCNLEQPKINSPIKIIKISPYVPKEVGYVRYLWFKVQYENTTNRAINAIEFEITCFNNFNDQTKCNLIDSKKTLKILEQNTVLPDKKYTLTVLVSKHKTKKIKVKVLRVNYEK